MHQSTDAWHRHACAICMRPDGSKPSYATGFGFFSSRLRSSLSWMHSAPMLRQSWYFSSNVSLHHRHCRKPGLTCGDLTTSALTRYRSYWLTCLASAACLRVGRQPPRRPLRFLQLCWPLLPVCKARAKPDRRGSSSGKSGQRNERSKPNRHSRQNTLSTVVVTPRAGRPVLPPRPDNTWL